MSTTLSTLSAAVPALGWATHGWWLQRRLDRARRDPLTGLFTRDGFAKEAPRRLDAAASAVLVLDLDGFKTLNDAHGHAAGDSVLAVTAQRLLRWQQSTSTVARLGGDEFAAAVSADSTDQVRRIVADLHQRLTTPVSSEYGCLTFGCSIGAATVATHPGADLPTLLRVADEAMYHAKQTCTGWAVADPWLPALGTRNGRRIGRRGAT